MASGNTVTLTFAGNAKPMSDAVDKVDDKLTSVGKAFDNLDSKSGAAMDNMTGSMDKAGKGTRDLSGMFDKFAVAGVTAVTAVATAITVGLQGALERSDVGALLAAQLGTASRDSEEYGRLAGQVWAKGVVESAAEASAFIKASLQNGLIPSTATDADITKMSETLAVVSKTLEDDGQNVANAVSQMIKTGLVDSATEGFDLLVAGARKGVNKAGDLMETFNEYGTQFRKLGLTGEDAMGLMSQAIQGGARDADVAADALKEFSLISVSGSKDSDAAYKKLGLDTQEMISIFQKGGPQARETFGIILDKLRSVKDPMERNNLALDLFGTKFEDLGTSLYSMDLDTAAQGFDDIGGSAKNAGDQLENSASAKLRGFKAEVQNALINKLAEALPYMDKFFNWVRDNSSWLVPLSGALLTFGIVLGGVALAIKGVALATAAWNWIMTTSPIGWIILLIVGLAAIIYIIATKTTWFQDIWKVAWDWIKKAAGSAWDWIKDKTSAFIDWISGIPERIRNVFSSLANWISAPFKAAFNSVSDAWNNTVGRLSWTVPGWVPSIGGNSISAPKLPRFHTGGTVPGIPGQEMLAILQAGEQVIPANRGGGGTTIVLKPDGTRAGAVLLELLRDAIGIQGSDIQVVVGGTSW